MSSVIISGVVIALVFLCVGLLFAYVAVIRPQNEELQRERAARRRAEEEAQRLADGLARVAGEQLRLRNSHAAHAEQHQTIRF